jgi:hypothetical protein
MANQPASVNIFARLRGSLKSVESSLTHELWVQESPSESRSVLIYIATVGRLLRSGCKWEVILGELLPRLVPSGRN